MKKFNKTINIEVSVDSIATKLLSMFNKEEKHAEITVEAIIGNLVAKNRVSDMYNAMHGFTNEINFEVGEIINPTLRVYAYWTPESITNNDTCYGNVTEATIIEIDEYRDENLKIEYSTPQKDGTSKLQTSWIHHSKCSKIPV